MQDTHLSHKHAHTLQHIFQHPTTHHLEWHDVTALVRESGTVLTADNGHLTFTLNGVSQGFHTSHGKSVCDVEQVLEIRHFLEKVGIKKDGTVAHKEETADEGMAGQDLHAHDRGHVNAEHNRHAEQQIKTQEHEQNDRSGFNEGDAQTHQQGNKQK